MANLSNLNNKFLVTTGGNVLIGTTADVATVRLQVKNASAAAVLRLTGGSDSWDFDTYYTDNKLFIKSSGAAGTVMTLLGASGNVGIGTDSPAKNVEIKGAALMYTTLRITSGSTTHGAEIEFGDSVDADYGSITQFATSAGEGGRMRFRAGGTETMNLRGGNVGIGTVSPTEKLSVSGNIELDDMPAAGSRYLITNETSTGTGRLNIQAGGGSATYGGGLSLIANSHASKPGWVIAGISSGAGTGATEGRFVVNTHGLGTGTDIFTVLRTGNVGIGTTTPQYKFHTYLTNGQIAMFGSNAQNSVGQYCGIGLGQVLAGGTSYQKISIVSEGRGSGNYISDLHFLVDTAGDAGSADLTDSKMMISGANGYVGIGTSSPGSPLDIVGNVYSTTRVQAGNTLIGTVGSYATLGSNSSSTGIAISRDWSPVTYPDLIITTAGNVGIGIAAPAKKLNVQGAGGDGIRVSNSTNSAYYSDLLINYNDVSSMQLTCMGTSILQAGNTGNTVLASRTNKDIVIDPHGTGNALISKTTSAFGTAGWRFSDDGSNGCRTSGTILDLNRLGTDGNVIAFYKASVLVGTIAVTGSATAFNTSSDYRLKEDLQDFNGLDKVSKIPVYDFKWKSDESRSYGVMAHELEEVLPQAVTGEKDAEKMQGVDYSKIVPLLVKSIQELKAEIDVLKSK